MKRITFLTALIIFNFSSVAQQADQFDSLFQTPQQQFEYISQNLDMSEITTGLVLDKSLPLLPIDFFNGNSLSDTNKANAKRFVDL